MFQHLWLIVVMMMTSMSIDNSSNTVISIASNKQQLNGNIVQRAISAENRSNIVGFRPIQNKNESKTEPFGLTPRHRDDMRDYNVEEGSGSDSDSALQRKVLPDNRRSISQQIQHIRTSQHQFNCYNCLQEWKTAIMIGCCIFLILFVIAFSKAMQYNSL